MLTETAYGAVQHNDRSTVHTMYDHNVIPKDYFTVNRLI